MVRDHALALQNGFDVVKAVFNFDGGDFYGPEEEFVDLGVSGGRTLLEKWIRFCQRVQRVGSLKRTLNVAVCISHLEGADYVNILSKRSDKTILCVHGSKLADPNIRGFIGWLRKRVLIPFLYNKADVIVTVSRDIIPELRSLGVREPKLVYINNFFDIDHIKSASDDPLPKHYRDIYSQDPTIITSGRLAPEKNLAALIFVFARLVQRTKVRLIILGDGALRRDLKKLALQLGLRVGDLTDGGDRRDADFDIYFMGAQENPFNHLKSSTLFVLPSKIEGFPLSLGEAMICGTPVLAADCQTGPREILAPRTRASARLTEAELADYGILMPILNPDKLEESGYDVWVETLDRLLRDKAERSRLSAAASKRMEDFRLEKIVPQWFALIDELVEPSP